MKINTLKQIISSGSQSFPIYVGFVTAENLLRVAEVPNFKNTTSNHDIAANVLTPPVKQWQRPLIDEKRRKITATFDGTGEFMPNPVLVAERCIGSPPGISVVQVMATGGIPTDIIEIDVPEPVSGAAPPLWIIDGQHRITGLGDSACKQKDSPIPIVLLLNSGGTFYNGRNLAKIFAQVTTEATPLATLHKEWLTFAFNLDKYQSKSAPHKAMECVASLCKVPDNVMNGKPNGFHDDIRFNDELDPIPSFLGHQYDCKDLSALIANHYYGEASSFPMLQPSELAHQISMAFEVLQRSVKAPHDRSVFFGDKKHYHKIMCDAYLVGLLAFLRTQNSKPTSSDWEALLMTLNFHQTDWDFQQHVISSSRWVDKSKRLAFDVFSKIFSDAALPYDVVDVWDYLAGDQLFIEAEFRHVNPKGNAVTKNRHRAKFSQGAKRTVPMGGRQYFKLVSRSTNAKHIQIVDEKSSPSAPVSFKHTGEYLRPPKVSKSNSSQDPLVLTIKLVLYGGIEEKITITLSNWK